MNDMKQILIIGSSGYIANNLYQNLKSEYQNVALASSSNTTEYSDNEKIINLNQPILRIIIEIVNLCPTEIIYCSSKYQNNSIRENLYVNLFLPLIISITSRIKNTKFIYIGSYWQLFPKLSKQFINRYTVSKSIVSFFLRILNWKSGNKISLLIICDTFGNDDKRNKFIPYLLECEKNKIKPIINNPNNYINLTNVNNVVNSILKIINHSDAFCYYCINELSVKVSDLQTIIHDIYSINAIDANLEDQINDFFIDTETALKINQKITSKMSVVPDLIQTVHQFKLGAQN
jgi:nucleoside-diphosphate-sugar epimerase